MQYILTCSFELKRARAEGVREVVVGLERLGLRVVPQVDEQYLSSCIVLGSFEAPQPAALRDRVCDELREQFDAQGCEWNAFVLVSGGESAWATMASRPKAEDPARRWVIVRSEARGENLQPERKLSAGLAASSMRSARPPHR